MWKLVRKLRKRNEKDDEKKSTSMKRKKNQHSIMSFMIKKPALESDKSCLETLIVNEETDTEEPVMCNNNEFDMNQDTVLETSWNKFLTMKLKRWSIAFSHIQEKQLLQTQS